MLAASKAALIGAGATDRERARPGCRPASGRWKEGCPWPLSAALSTGTPSTGSVRHRRGHAGQVGGAAGAGHDHLQPARLGAGGVGHHALGRAMGGDDAGLERHAQRFEGLGGVAHGRPVRLAAHDQADQPVCGGVWRRIWPCSGDDIGNQLAFQLEDLVLEPELALLQALQLELVEGRLLEQAVDHLVEVAMLALQRFQLGLDRLGVQRIEVGLLMLGALVQAG